MPPYELARYANTSVPSLELSQAEYDAIRVAVHRVRTGLALEGLCDMMLGNYEEFERELLSIGLQYAIYHGAGDEWDAAMNTLQLVARRVANCLTTAQAYCDHLPHLIADLYGRNTPRVEEVRGLFRHEHSQVLGYRVCVELRRYAQHRGAVVHAVHAATARDVGREGPGKRLCSAVPEVSVFDLRGDPKFKPSVLYEMRQAAAPAALKEEEEYLDLRPHLRQYVSALGRIHLQVRAIVAPDLAASDDLVMRLIARFRALPDTEDLAGLAVIAYSDDGHMIPGLPTFLLPELIERRRRLERRNQAPVHFEQQVITNDPNMD